MKIKLILFVLVGMFALQAEARHDNNQGQQCASIYVDSYDIGGCDPYYGRTSIASASHGDSRYVSCTKRHRTCTAELVCDNGRFYFEGLDCTQRSRGCENKTFTVYDLGGWEPIGGRYSTGRGHDGEYVYIPTRSSDGRSCNIAVECQGNNWQPDWATSRCP